MQRRWQDSPRWNPDRPFAAHWWCAEEHRWRQYLDRCQRGAAQRVFRQRAALAHSTIERRRHQCRGGPGGGVLSALSWVTYTSRRRSGHAGAPPSSSWSTRVPPTRSFHRRWRRRSALPSCLSGSRWCWRIPVGAGSGPARSGSPLLGAVDRRSPCCSRVASRCLVSKRSKPLVSRSTHGGGGSNRAVQPAHCWSECVQRTSAAARKSREAHTPAHLYHNPARQCRSASGERGRPRRRTWWLSLPRAYSPGFAGCTHEAAQSTFKL